MRRVVLLLSPLLWSVLFCAAQESATQEYTVHGVVVNSLSNQPIARAEVILDQDSAVMTDGEGRFSFEKVAAGQHSMSVERPGYLGFGIAGGSPFRIRFPGQLHSPRPIQVGPDMPDLTIRLTPTGAIRGQISLSSNDPAEGLRITILGKALQNGRMRWSLAGNTTTNSEGSFHLGSLPAGDYMLQVGSSLDRSAQPTGEKTIMGYPPEYYPGVTDAGSAGVLTVAAGQTVEADVSMTRQAFYPVTAMVRAGDGVRPGGFQILDSSGRPANLPVRYDAQQQLAHVNVPSGRWALQASAYGRSQSFGRTDFQVAGGPVSLAITILPIPKLQVVIRHEFTSNSNQPVAYVGPAIMAGGTGPGVNLQLVSAQPTAMGGMTSSHIDSNSDPAATEWNGAMEATPGEYWVQAQVWIGYVRSITSGGVDLMSNPLILSPNRSNAPIEVVMRNDSGTITGQIAAQTAGSTTVQTAAGEIPEIHVYAIPLFGFSGQAPSEGVQSTGQFQMQNLAPGSYRVVACDLEQEIDFRSPEGLAEWAGKGQLVKVEPDGTATVQLDVMHMEAQ